jgi:hypothetical protein
MGLQAENAFLLFPVCEPQSVCRQAATIQGLIAQGVKDLSLEDSKRLGRSRDTRRYLDVGRTEGKETCGPVDWNRLLKGVLGMAFPFHAGWSAGKGTRSDRSIKAPLWRRLGKAAPFIPQQKTVELCNLRSLVGSFGILG